MEAIERVVSYTGLRRRAPTDPPARGWRRVNRFGRYLPETELPAALAAQERTRALAEADGYRTWLWRVCNESVDTEINVELGEFTIKSSRAMLTPVHMGDFDDYRQLFGPTPASWGRAHHGCWGRGRVPGQGRSGLERWRCCDGRIIT